MSREPLTLALIVNLYPPYVVGGNEILARDVVEALRARGHTVHVLTGRGRELPRNGFTHGVLDLDLDRKDEVFLGGLPLTMGRAIRWHLYHHPSYRAVRATLAVLAPDLVIAWNLYGVSMAPLVASRRFRAPVVAQPADKWLLHGLTDLGRLLPAVRLWARWGLGVVRRTVQPVLRRLACPDYLLTISEFIRRLHVEAGFPAERSRATYLGIPIEQFPARPPDFPEGRPWRLVFAGQLWEGKGPQVAVEAVRRLSSRGDVPRVELDVFGSGNADFLAHLERLIAGSGLGSAVRLRGFVSRERLADEFRRHDLFLFCSTWDEPFSGGLLEALCAGLPAVATAAGGTPEAIRDGENGILVPPRDPQALADAVVRLMRDRALYLRLCHRAAADVRERWSFDGYVERLERAYTAIVSSHRVGGRPALEGP